VLRLGAAGYRRVRVLVGLDSRVALGAASKGRSSSGALNRHLRRLTAACLTYEIRLSLFWLPSWANSSDAPSRLSPLESWANSLPPGLPSWDEVLEELRLARDRRRACQQAEWLRVFPPDPPPGLTLSVPCAASELPTPRAVAVQPGVVGSSSPAPAGGAAPQLKDDPSQTGAPAGGTAPQLKDDPSQTGASADEDEAAGAVD